MMNRTDIMLYFTFLSLIFLVDSWSTPFEFPRTNYGDRQTILKSEEFSEAIAFIDRIHEERYSSYSSCPILSQAWEKYDFISTSTDFYMNVTKDFTSYSVKDQRKDIVLPWSSVNGFQSSSSRIRKKNRWSSDKAMSFEVPLTGGSNPELRPPGIFGDYFCHVTNVPIMTNEECQTIISEAQNDNGKSDAWKSHDHYYKAMKITKVIADDMPMTKEILGKACIHRIFPLLQLMYPTVCPDGVHGLRRFRIFSAKVIKYDSSTCDDYLGVHHDGSLMTFLIGLNELDDYKGGGTFIEPLGKSIRYGRGQLLCHPGIIRHGGDKVTDGVRYVLAVWIDIYGVKEYDRQLSEEADLIRLSGRLDQSITLEENHSGIIARRNSKKAEEYYLYSLAVGEMFSEDDRGKRMKDPARLSSENALLGLGQLWLENGLFNKASTLFSQALNVNPYNIRSWNSYGLSLIKLSDFQGAITAFEKAAMLNEHEFDSLSNLGLLQSTLGRHSEAVDTFEKALKRVSQGKDGVIKADNRRVAELYTNWGVTLCDLGRYKQALVAFSKASVIDPTFIDAALNLQTVKNLLVQSRYS